MHILRNSDWRRQAALAIMIQEKHKTCRVPDVREQQDLNRKTTPNISPDFLNCLLTLLSVLHCSPLPQHQRKKNCSHCIQHSSQDTFKAEMRVTGWLGQLSNQCLILVQVMVSGLWDGVLCSFSSSTFLPYSHALSFKINK